MLALVSCRAALDLDTDLTLLRDELPEARVVVWDDPSVDWKRFDVVIIRSAWDYHQRRDQFVRWAKRVESVSRLWNPPALIEWNTDKRYLLDLQRQGIPIVPTVFVESGAAARDLDLAGDLVIKPSVGAGSNGLIRTRGDRALARKHIERLLASRLTAMVQPYLADVDIRGETGLVFLGGRFSHAFEKAPILAKSPNFESGLFAEEQIRHRLALSEEIEIGERVVAMLQPTAYARVDLLPTHHGSVVVEVEVTEPSLYLDCDDGAPARAAAVFRSLSP